MMPPGAPGARRPRLRIGVIGAGNIATLAHIPGLLRTGDVEIAAICDPDASRAAAAATRFRVGNVFDRYEHMLEGTRLDAVTVASPPATHAAAVLAALDIGLHVLCEKPMATSVADAERMVDKAERVGAVLATDFHFRALRESVALKAAIDEGRLGAIRYVHIRYLRNDFAPPLGSWAWDRSLSGGGTLTDMGSHLIDLALWLAGSDVATSVDAQLGTVGEYDPARPPGSPAGVEDFASLRMRLDNGATAMVECSWGFPGADESRIQVIGERGGAEVAPRSRGRSAGLTHYAVAGDGQVSRSSEGADWRSAGSRVSYAVATGAPSSRRPRPPSARSRRGRLWHPTMAGFVAAIRGDGHPVASGRDGLAVQRVLEAAYRSHEQGRPVA